MASLALFEDAASGHFNPLVRTRAIFDLRAGILTFKDRIEQRLGVKADVLLCRDEVAGVTRDRHPGVAVNPEELPDETLLVNGRWIPESGELLTEISAVVHGEVVLQASTIWASGQDVVARWGAGDSNDTRDAVDARLATRLWQLVSDPGELIAADAHTLDGGEAERPAPWPDLTVVHEENIVIDSSAIVGAGVILNGSSGPIIVEADAVIGDGAILKGPCHIGAMARINAGARIVRSSVGFNSRAGGEISKSILLAHSNKWHDGYLGNSYIGEWCNIGADANTSNLRNDYGKVSLYSEELGAMETTSEQFLGTIMADHSVCGINTMFNTGTVVGVCCNVFGAGYQPRYIKSFSWGGRERMMQQNVRKAILAAETVMARRDKAMSAAHRALLEQIAATTA
jgi:UDP-N-acetylglucosamine diphosphorylase/glucosamine-1-phosphate N-acetyltransferase